VSSNPCNVELVEKTYLILFFAGKPIRKRVLPKRDYIRSDASPESRGGGSVWEGAGYTLYVFSVLRNCWPSRYNRMADGCLSNDCRQLSPSTSKTGEGQATPCTYPPFFSLVFLIRIPRVFYLHTSEYLSFFVCREWYGEVDPF
jgi:hypothetical protein